MSYKLSMIAWIIIFMDLIAWRPGNIFTSGACRDTHGNCAYWASIGECKKNYLWMLQKCPKSCKVCTGGVSCVNVYKDQYCNRYSGSCWDSNYATIMVNNCRKTCVCSCCPTTTPPPPPPTTTTTTTTTPPTTITTTVTSTTISTALQITTEGTGEETTTALTSLSTQTTSEIKETSTSPITTTKENYGDEQDRAGMTQRSGINTLLLAAIIAGVVAVIGILGLSLFCFWRRKRSVSLNQPRKSPPPTESVQIPVTESNPDSLVSPLYDVLEGPNYTFSGRDQALSVHYDGSSERFRSESDYDEPANQGARAMIGLPSKARENDATYETVDKDRNPKSVMKDASKCPTLENSVEYCYSYSVANQELSSEVNKNTPHEVPNRQGPVYHELERPNTEYKDLQSSSAAGKKGDGAMRDIDPNGYQPLNKATRSFYHPLKKTTKPPQRAFTRT